MQATTFGHPLSGELPPGGDGPAVVAAIADDSFLALLSSHSGATRPSYAVQGTIWHDTDLVASTPLIFFDGTNDRFVPVEDVDGNISVSGSAIILQTQETPASSTAPGVAGTIVHDADYIYVCTATDTWKRVAIATW